MASDLANEARDLGHLVTLVDQVEANAGQVPQEVLAAAVYYSERNGGELAKRGIEAFIPPYKVKHTVRRDAPYPRGRIPPNLSARDRM